jgi:glycosyltransferase involved in cell wall biosynthesis
LGAVCEKCGGRIIDNSHVVGKNTKVLFGNNRLFFKRTEVDFSKESLAILNSPLVSLETWEALVRGSKALISEEYYEKGGLKDAVMSSALRPFRGYPFASSTKRTHEFLMKRGFQSLLVPPAIEMGAGRKKREDFLFVGKMIPSKNPLFFLEIAKRMKKESFVMIGDGPMILEVKEKAKGLGNVEVIREVGQKELFSEYYPRAKALIHPTFKDPIGFVIIEALSRSTPVVASVNVGASDYLPKEWTVENYDVGEWAAKAASAGGDAEKAAGVFESEHLGINDPYFDEISEKLFGIFQKKGWV